MARHLTKRFQRNLLLFLSILLIITAFWRLLFYNFVKDDFFHLWISQYTSLEEFINFFTFGHSLETSKYNFYRPLTTQAYYGIFKSLFNFNPLPFHVASLALHLINSLLVLVLAKLFLGNKMKIFPILAALFYGLNPSHTITVGWVANFQELGVTFFAVLSIYYFYKHLNYNKLIFLLSSVGFFILALLSKETAIVIPIILLLMIWLFGRERSHLRLLPFLIILVSYIYLHFIKYQFVQTEGYTVTVDLQAVNTFRWYLWWALGFPEPLTNFIGANFKILPAIWNSFLRESVIIFSLFLALIIGIIYQIFIILNNNRKTIFDKKLIFFILFYIIFLLPVLFLPQNRYAYHQTTALVGLSLFLVLLLKKVYDLKWKHTKFVVVSFTAVTLLLFLASIDLTIENHQVTYRAIVTDKVLKSFLATHPQIPKDSIIYIKNDPNNPFPEGQWGTATQASYALNGDYAFKIHYGESIKVYYEKVKPLPVSVDKSKVIEHTAVF